MYVGSHVSIRKGYLGAAQTAFSIGANAYQYFAKNPRSITVKSFNREDAVACAAYCRERGIVSIVHTAYPTNLSVEKGEKRELTIRSLYNDLEIAEACGSIGVVVHFGKYKGNNRLRGYEAMIEVLNSLLAQWSGQAQILLENNAGSAGQMGTTLDELVTVRQLAQHPEQIGFCLDTCHAFVSGLWNGENSKELVRYGQQIDYFKHLKAIHFNDSSSPNGSLHDRHAPVGKGYIGEECMRELLKLVQRDIPLILETPTDQANSHRDEIRYVRSLVQ